MSSKAVNIEEGIKKNKGQTMDDKIKVQYTVNSKVLFQYMLKLQHHILHIFTWRKGGWKEKRNLQWNKIIYVSRGTSQKDIILYIFLSGIIF